MPNTELLSAYIEQSKLLADMVRQFVAVQAAAPSHESPLVEVVRRQQETIDKMQETLDRVVTSRYDRPVVPMIKDQESVQMPMFALNDQDDPSIEAGLAAITAESDEEFLAAAGVR